MEQEKIVEPDDHFRIEIDRAYARQKEADPYKRAEMLRDLASQNYLDNFNNPLA